MHTTSRHPLQRPAPGQGRQLLIDAAVRLSTRSRSLTTTGIRELAREAGLNPNTFYRHFTDMVDLAGSLIRDEVAVLRQPLRQLRREAALAAERQLRETSPAADPAMLQRQRIDRVVDETVRLCLDHAQAHPAPYLIGARELHGPSPAIRRLIQEEMAGFADDLSEDVSLLKLLPADDAGLIRQVAELVVRNMFQFTLDLLESPGERPAIEAQAGLLIKVLFAGISALQREAAQPC
jgi:AcrR family transcriptional regulator